jgi:hypothetical protein
MPGPIVQNRPRRRARARWLALLACAGLILAGVRAVSEGSGQDRNQSRNREQGRGVVDPPADWPSGRPVAVAAPGGRARFSVPTPRPGSRTLVIVSTLAMAPGPFPVRLEARGVNPESLRPVETEPAGPRRAPDLRAPIAPPSDRLAEGLPPRERTFHLMVRDGDVASASNYQAVRGKLRAVGHRVQVYVDQADDPSVGPEVLRDLVTMFDDRVFPVASRTIGRARDVDGDGRFTVLISGWLSRLAGGKYSVDGFVRGADFAPGLPAPFGNRCDMMYLSTALGPGPHLRTVLAHEYTHAVTFCAKSFPDPPTRPPALEEEGWLDEALAHLAEDLHGFARSNLDYRVSAFLSQPERYRLVVDDYYAADLFRSHGNRGGTYLFLRWCADLYGTGLLPALVRSERRGVANLEAATGERFADLYRAWSVALFLSGFDPSTVRGGGFRSVDVRGPFDDWELAGPRTVPVVPDGPAETWQSAGTASRFLLVEPSPAGAVAVEVSAPPDAGLQVTALAVPDDLARLTLTARPEPGPGGVPCLRLQVAETRGTAVSLTAVCWEPLVPGPDPHAAGFRRGGLDALGIASGFGTTALPPLGRLDSKPIPAGDALASGVPLVLKAVGTDARGRRVAGWAELRPPTEERRRE